SRHGAPLDRHRGCGRPHPRPRPGSRQGNRLTPPGPRGPETARGPALCRRNAGGQVVMNASETPENGNDHALSEVLDRLEEAVRDKETRIADIIEGLGRRSFPAIMLIPALLAVSPL